VYHWEADHGDFLVLAGVPLLIVGAGDTPCVVVAVGARDRSTGPDWGGYPVDEAALRHRAGVEQETTDQHEAYAHLPRRAPTGYHEGWLPDT
jgi:hypothetical protein